jgi:predicted ATPase/class 3 adenylate cyclase
VQGVLRAFLVTDIVDSTRLWAEHGSAMAIDLVSHDEIVNAVVASVGGVVFKHTGDGVMATFDSADASAEAAVEIQRAIRMHAWEVPEGIQVRVALHSGSAHERGGDLFGLQVNRLARLLSCCPPGAVLVSEATAALLADEMPAGLVLVDLGQVQLRGVGRSEAVACLAGEHLVAVDPQDVVGPASRRVGSLPAIDDELVGRTEEIVTVLDAVAAHPVVSIVGVGGMGKTRLALEAAAVADIADGVWWCDLTTATSPDALPSTVLAAIGGHQAAGRSPVECIVDCLTGRRALVVFDNCEHVTDAARVLVSAIRAGCADVRVLATSREALGMRGEHVVSLSSLPSTDAIGLFCTRANEARTDLVFDDPTLAVIEEICSSVDGIPLAIELAAARCRAMTPAEIAARLDARFRLLRGGRGGVERHRTLQAAVDWSYSLLEDDERDVFDRMAVFAGGGLIDAIATVVGLDEYEVLDILERLIVRSMVVAVDTALGTRYRQLETLRQYADDRLLEHGRADATRDRHLDWARMLVTRLRNAHLTSAEFDGFRRYIVEVDNLRAAVHYAVATDRRHEACEIIAAIGLPATARPTFEIADWCDPTRVPAAEWTDAVASAAGVCASLSLFAGNTTRTKDLLAVIPPEHQHNTWALAAATYESIWVTGDFDAAEARLGVAARAERHDGLRLAQLRGQLFQWRLRTDRATDVEYARAALTHCEDVIAQMRKRDAQLSLASALVIYGYCLEGSGNLTKAVAVQSEAIDLCERLGAANLADSARAGLVGAITKIAETDPGQLDAAAATLRTTLAIALHGRGYLNIAGLLVTAVERVLWAAGDHRTAALIGKCGRYELPTGALLPSAVDPTILDADTIAEIESEAAQLDIEAAAAIALAALDRIVGTSD